MLRRHGRLGCREEGEQARRVKRVDQAALGKLNMVWEGEHGKLVCRTCEEVVDMAKLDQHWTRRRHKAAQHVSEQHAADVRRALGSHIATTPTAYALPDPYSPSIRSLPSYRGYACTVEGCAWARLDGFEQHWRKAHQSSLGPPSEPHDATLQQWTDTSRFFEVQRPEWLRSRAPQARLSSSRRAASHRASSAAQSSSSARGAASFHSGAEREADAAFDDDSDESYEAEGSEGEASAVVLVEPSSNASATQASRTSEAVPAPRSTASQRAAPASSLPVQRPAASGSSYQPSSATQRTSSRQQPRSSSASKPPSTAPSVSSASRQSGARPTNLRSYFGRDADKWKSASRAAKVTRGSATLNTCTWRNAEETIDEAADVCEMTFHTGEALARHVMSKHVRHAPIQRGKIM